MRIKGFDINRAQENINFDKIEKSGAKFVILRAGIRTDTDTYFQYYLDECIKRKLPYGLFWYFEATSDEAFDKELAACVKVVKGLKPEYPVFFDMEEQRQIDNLTIKERTDMALKFCKKMTEIGLPSGIYANPSWMLNYYDSDRLDGIDIWLAHWTNNPDVPSKFNYGQKIWQWGTELVDERKVDSNICFVDYPSLTSKWYKEHGGKTNDSVKTYTKSENKTSCFKSGDKVKVKSGAFFSNGIKPISAVYTAEFVIQRLSKDGTEACIGIDGQDTGWMFCKDLILSTKVASENKPMSDSLNLKVGDIVRIKNGSKTYDGMPIDDWVFYKRFYVSSVNGNRVVLNRSPDSTVLAINTAFNITDLKKV